MASHRGGTKGRAAQSYEHVLGTRAGTWARGLLDTTGRLHRPAEWPIGSQQASTKAESTRHTAATLGWARHRVSARQ